ncbi:hypothetical protein KIN20_022310 [Parelaphostrongylus tenuis]|uniref:Uncharacterized protein n=1 Tax=Parelaphostrongylus tenuis TaxID=148309 RepID=A0AAD5QWP6_PARTN|nr:hypothetical protein KIN20_022310 [Parelaphostrongylus tenuis]
MLNTTLFSLTIASCTRGFTVSRNGEFDEWYNYDRSCLWKLILSLTLDYQELYEAILQLPETKKIDKKSQPCIFGLSVPLNKKYKQGYHICEEKTAKESRNKSLEGKNNEKGTDVEEEITKDDHSESQERKSTEKETDRKKKTMKDNRAKLSKIKSKEMISEAKTSPIKKDKEELGKNKEKLEKRKNEKGAVNKDKEQV